MYSHGTIVTGLEKNIPLSNPCNCESRDSVVSIVTTLSELDCRKIAVRFSTETRGFPLLKIVQSGSGSIQQLIHYAGPTGDDGSTKMTTIIEVGTAWNYNSTPASPNSVHRNNFTFTLKLYSLRQYNEWTFST
jgi:hypothetical protein